MNIFENNGDVRATVLVCYENHATDARVKEIDTAPTAGATDNGSYRNLNPIVLCKTK